MHQQWDNSQYVPYGKFGQWCHHGMPTLTLLILYALALERLQHSKHRTL